MSKLDKKTTGTDDLGSVFQGVMRQALMQIEGMLPAVVTAVDRPAGRVSVKPLVMAGTAEGDKVSRPVVPNIPIMTMGAGGIYASFPVKVGDQGFVFSASRDTSLFYQSQGGEDWPNTERIHSFSDGAFLPLKLFNFSIAGGVLADGFSLQTDDGSTFVTLKSGEVQITATKVKIVGDIEHTGDTWQLGDVEHIGNMQQTGDIEHTGNTKQTGNIEHTGNAKQTGDIEHTGNQKIVGDIEHTGNTKQTGDVEQIGDVAQTGASSVDGDRTITGALTATSIATPSLTVAGKDYAGHNHPYSWTSGDGTGNTGGVN